MLETFGSKIWKEYFIHQKHDLEEAYFCWSEKRNILLNQERIFV